MTMTQANRHSTQQGFSLLEVLMALVILSIGLLGIAALQTIGLKVNHDAYQRTQAVFQAYDIIDRMRANGQGLSAGTYNSVASGATPGSANCASAACTPVELAEYDIRTWNQANAKILSAGKGAISSDAGLYTITVSWSENDLPMKVTVVTQP
jgi:type IV pilus assembly protein PilV